MMVNSIGILTNSNVPLLRDSVSLWPISPVQQPVKEMRFAWAII
jgi:hypothetical protein